MSERVMPRAVAALGEAEVARSVAEAAVVIGVFDLPLGACLAVSPARRVNGLVPGGWR